MPQPAPRPLPPMPEPLARGLRSFYSGQLSAGSLGRMIADHRAAATSAEPRITDRRRNAIKRRHAGASA